MYIHIGRTASTTASLKVTLASGSSAAKWNILTRQIECDTAWAAPDGCSMWLTGTTGEWMGTHTHQSGRALSQLLALLTAYTGFISELLALDPWHNPLFEFTLDMFRWLF